MSTTDAEGLLPASSLVKIPAEGAPYLEGQRCDGCGELLVGDFTACPACAARGALKPARLAETGRVHSFTIVHRSFPGVSTPFVSAVVELDGGGYLKGTLAGVEATPEAARVGLPIRVRIGEAPVRDAKGRRYLAYDFAPRQIEGDY